MKSHIDQKIEALILVRKEIPELTFFGERCLHQKSEDVTLEQGVITAGKLETTLLKYRELTGLGRGIAAPQIGINENVFITYVGDEVQVYINPIIEEYSEETNFYRELCMSSGVMWADIERPESIVLSWTDEKGDQHSSVSFSGPEARVLQHEYDHIQGTVCLDKAIAGTISFVDADPAEEGLREESL